MQFALELLVAPDQLPLEPLQGEMRLDPGDDLLGLEGLRQVVRGAGLEAPNLVCDFVERGQEDDDSIGELWIRPQLPAGLVPVHARRQYIQQDEIGACLGRDAQRVLPGLCDQQPVPAAVECLLQHLQVGGVIIDQEKTHLVRRARALGVG